MRFKRNGENKYISYDGRVVIEKHISSQSKGADEVSWSVHIDGKIVGWDTDTKKDAVAMAIKKLQEINRLDTA